MDVLVIDVGGTNVKLWHTAHEEHRRFESGKTLTPEKMVEFAKPLVQDWHYEAVALGLPCRVSNGRAVEDPANLGPGWIGYNFVSALGQPVRILNDAALQALGSYDGGRMLFMGLGTGVGSALVAPRLLLSLALGLLRYGDVRVCDVLDDKGFQELGPKKWKKALLEIVPSLKHALMADYVVLGGGNVKELDEFPDGLRRGHNRAVVEGGRRLWEQLPDPAASGSDWIIV
jgi:polyphosphate glucokinase